MHACEKKSILAYYFTQEEALFTYTQSPLPPWHAKIYTPLPKSLAECNCKLIVNVKSISQCCMQGLYKAFYSYMHSNCVL